MTLSSTLTLLFGSGVLLSVVKYIVNRLKKTDQRTEAVCYGVQALLRDRLYDKYDYWHEEKHYAPKHVKENFENMYNRYHALGVNGVMDQHYVDFMNLPDSPEK